MGEERGACARVDRMHAFPIFVEFTLGESIVGYGARSACWCAEGALQSVRHSKWCGSSHCCDTAALQPTRPPEVSAACVCGYVIMHTSIIYIYIYIPQLVWLAQVWPQACFQQWDVHTHAPSMQT